MERLILKARVDGIDFAPVIASVDGLKTAVWKDQAITLRDDEVSVTEGDPEESEIFSHENDAPEDYDISGSGLSVVGSFIKMSFVNVGRRRRRNTGKNIPALFEEEGTGNGDTFPPEKRRKSYYPLCQRRCAVQLQ
jgi:hypothetical protein